MVYMVVNIMSMKNHKITNSVCYTCISLHLFKIRLSCYGLRTTPTKITTYSHGISVFNCCLLNLQIKQYLSHVVLTFKVNCQKYMCLLSGAKFHSFIHSFICLMFFYYLCIVRFLAISFFYF